MDKLEEAKQAITNYKNSAECVRKSLGAIGIDTYQLHVDGDKLYKLSKEIGVEFKIEKRDCYQYPFEISAIIDDFKLYGLLTWEYVKKHKLSKKCPTCGSKV